MKTKNLLLLLTVLLGTSIFADVVVIDRDYVNTLPLNIKNRDQFCYYSYSNSGEDRAGISVDENGYLHFKKPAFTSDKGESNGIIHFDGVPGILTLDVTLGKDNACMFTKDHNKLYVYSGSKIDNLVQHEKIISNEQGVFKYVLKKEDKYVKFKFTNTSGLCGHKYSPVKVSLPSVVSLNTNILDLSGSATNILTETISINYSNPIGNIGIRSDNEALLFEKITEDNEAGKEGIVKYKVTYPANLPGNFNGLITAFDSGNEVAFVKIPYSIASMKEFFPETPNISLVNKTFESFTIVWDDLERVIDYKITVENANTILVDELIKSTSYKLNNLVRGNKYKITLIAIADNGNQSQIAAELNINTLEDFGTQIENIGFENWENIAGYGQEPINWNSFGTAKASGIFGSAKGIQVMSSNEVRPNSKGTYSANIFSKYIDAVIFSAYANGNLTTGRIVAGSATPTDYANYNSLVLDNPNFCQHIDNVLPDSISVWVKYVPAIAKEDMYARISFIAHAEGEVRDPRAQESPLTIAIAEENYNEANKWIRLSVPFKLNPNYDPNSNSSKIYILGSFTTNMTPGVATDASGKTPDNVYIDDLLFIYKPTLEINSLSKEILTEGDEISIDFKLEGTMSASNINEERNQVTVELSDKNGSFENPTVISVNPLLTDESGIITALLPDQLYSGSYKVRVATTNYPMNSEPRDIEVKGSLITSINDKLSSDINVSIYPNPAKEILNIVGANGMSYKVYNINGAVAMKGIMNQSNINVTSLSEGVYFIEFESNAGKSIVKFIKK